MDAVIRVNYIMKQIKPKTGILEIHIGLIWCLTLISNCSWINLIELKIDKFDNGLKINICLYQQIYHIKLYTWTIDYYHSIVEILLSLKYPHLGTIWGGKYACP